nr:hypothetical protein BaRGS_013261 [Batillaria attramentaria]
MYRYLDEMESHPDHWLRRTVYTYWLEAKSAVADFVGADAEDIFFVTNATTGVNVILRSCQLKPGDAIMANSLTYGAMKNLWRDLTRRIYPTGK